MKAWKLARCPCRIWDVTQALFIKPSQDFLSWAFFLLSRHILCVLLLFPHISPLGKVLLETFRRGEHVRMQLGRDGITGWSKTELPTLNIFRAALCSEQWLAATDWHHLLHSQWLWSQDCWTWYTLQLNNYFWYLHFGVDGAKRTKQRTSGALEEHFILGRQKVQLSEIHVISPSLSGVERYRVAGERS